MDVNVLIGAALTCVAGGFLPWINTEIVVIGAAILMPPSALPALVIGCALGQMAAKCSLYGVTRWAPDRLPTRARKLLARAERYRERRRLLALAVFPGSLVAIPPFYLVTLACGMLRVPFALFAVAGLLGTAMRYGFLVWASIALGVS